MDEAFKNHLGEMAESMFRQAKLQRQTEYFHKFPGVEVKLTVTPTDDRVWFSKPNDPSEFPEPTQEADKDG